MVVASARIESKYLDASTGVYYTRKKDQLTIFTPPTPQAPYQSPNRAADTASSSAPSEALPTSAPLVATPTQFPFVSVAPKTKADTVIRFTPLHVPTSAGAPVPKETPLSRMEPSVDTQSLRPGQAITLGVTKRQAAPQPKRVQVIPTLAQIQRISGHTRRGLPACFVVVGWVCDGRSVEGSSATTSSLIVTLRSPRIIAFAFVIISIVASTPRVVQVPRGVLWTGSCLSSRSRSIKTARRNGVAQWEVPPSPPRSPTFSPSPRCQQARLFLVTRLRVPVQRLRCKRRLRRRRSVRCSLQRRGG